tara:strand:+ start:886 stop:1095 length:210 start_codon:yes stop_codon:yes gene_type:complete
MPRYHNINGVQVQFTVAEEAARDAEQAQDTIDEETRKNTSIQRQTDRTNAKAKLIAGQPLTEAEANTIV